MGAPAKWWRRDRSDRLLILEAFVLLGIARLLIGVVPFRFLARSLGHSRADGTAEVPPADQLIAGRVGWAVRTVANHTPWKSVCLPQAMAGQWMLLRRGIAGTVRLGVRWAKDQPGQLAAHAWLSCGAEVLTGAPGHGEFTVVATFPRRP